MAADQLALLRDAEKALTRAVLALAHAMEASPVNAYESDYQLVDATLRKLRRHLDGVGTCGEAQQPGETYLQYLARSEREGRNPKPSATDPDDLCREPGCNKPPVTPVHAWCREHDRNGGFPHA